jgi:hypothetical protein
MSVARVRDLPAGSLETLFARFGLTVVPVADGAAIPGSYWGEPEAGLLGTAQEGRLYVRGDTPVHSALHEGCHWILMDEARKAALDTDAGGEDVEECGVCYLQILLAGHLPGIGRERLCRDMDSWGYSFRLGSTAAWFAEDAEDGREWLHQEGWLTDGDEVIFRPRHP